MHKVGENGWTKERQKNYTETGLEEKHDDGSLWHFTFCGKVKGYWGIHVASSLVLSGRQEAD